MGLFWGLCQVKLGEFFMAKEDRIYAVLWRGSQSNRLALEGLAEAEGAALEMELAFALDVAGVVVRAVGNRRVGAGKGAVTDAIPVGRHGHVEGFVRSLGVVVSPPAIKGALGVGSIAEGGIAQQVGLQRTVEPFVLA